MLATLKDGPRRGYAIAEALRNAGGSQLDLPIGTVYPALHRLEAAGLIVGSWSMVDGRLRRVYRLTGAGRRLHDNRSIWCELAIAMYPMQAMASHWLIDDCVGICLDDCRSSVARSV